MENDSNNRTEQVPDSNNHIEQVSDSNNHTVDLDLLPVEPEKPLATDCCGSGCVPCVMDIYEQEMKLWEIECANIKLGLPPDGGNSCITTVS